MSKVPKVENDDKSQFILFIPPTLDTLVHFRHLNGDSKCVISLLWPANSVKTGIIPPQKINEKLQINWRLKNIARSADHTRFIRKRNRFS